VTFLEALDHLERSPLFHPRGFDPARVAAAVAPVLGFDVDGIDLWAHAETCPKCGAMVGEMCTRRAAQVEPHSGRREVALLRLARLWVPAPGEMVAIGPSATWSWPEGDAPSKLVRFVGFAPDGAAIVEADWPMGGRTARARGEPERFERGRRSFETLCLWRVAAIPA